MHFISVYIIFAELQPAWLRTGTFCRHPYSTLDEAVLGTMYDKKPMFGHREGRTPGQEFADLNLQQTGLPVRSWPSESC